VTRHAGLAVIAGPGASPAACPRRRAPDHLATHTQLHALGLLSGQQGVHDDPGNDTRPTSDHPEGTS